MPTTVSHANNFNLIRLAAALQVLLVHAVNHFGITGAWTAPLKIMPGVPTFFFISGYLVYASYDRIGSKKMRKFFANRALRIYPGLLVCVVLALLSIWVTGYFQDRSIGVARIAIWLAAQGSILQFWNPGFFREYGVGVVNGALWTISVELQFYLLMPLLHYLVTTRRALAVAIFAASVVMNLLLQWYMDWSLLPMKLAYVSFGPWLYMFMLGCFFASTPRVKDWVHAVNVWLLVAAYVVSMIFIGTYTTNASNSINPISFALLSLLILKLSTVELKLPARLQAFIRKNDFSYGLYLYHMPIINFVLVMASFAAATNVAVVLLAALVAAAGSWYLVEAPALRHKR